MIDKIIKNFFIKERIEKDKGKLTIIRNRCTEEFREIGKARLQSVKENPEEQKTSLSGYFEGVVSLYRI